MLKFKEFFRSTRRGQPRSTALVAGVLFLLLLLGRSEPATAQRQVPTDYVFIIDVSGSMAGAGGSANIFPQVQNAISTFLGQIAPGSDVFVAPFADAVRELKRFPINTSADIASAQAYVNGLVANGNNTAIYNSVNSVLASINDLHQKSGGDRTAVYFLYTDGNDNVSKGWNLGSFLKNFSLKRGQRDWLFYSELGLPRDPAKESAFSQFERMRYVQQSKGTVHPIVQIQTLLPILNFGNLKKQPSSSRVEKFAMRGLSSLTAPISIAGEVSFPALKSQGVFAQVKPESFTPSDSVNLELSLVNSAALADSDYHGVLTLTPSDPLVLVVPSEIELSFSYGETQEVSVEPGPGTRFPLDFGKLQLLHKPTSAKSKLIVTHFSPTAVKAAKSLRFLFEDNAANPKPVSSRLSLLDTDGSALAGSIPSSSRQLTLNLSVDSTLSPGTYSGQIRFEGDGLLVKGDGLAQAGDDGATLPWRFEVKRAPVPLWLWALIALLLVLGAWLLARHLMKPAIFSDLKLDVTEPQRQQIDLSGKSVARFGTGHDLLPMSKTAFSINAKKDGKRQTAVLTVDNGPMLIKKQGTRDEATVIGDEEIFDGDVLHFGDHRARVSSFSLVRE